jgi:hypothetical protein
LQWFHSPVWRLETFERKLKSSNWNYVLESLCQLDIEGSGSIPPRVASRRLWLDRGWIRVA